MSRWFAALAAAVALMGAPAHAQDNKDMVVVTGSLIQSDEGEESGRVGVFGGGPPYVSLIVPADFVIFTVSLETGTRSIDERQRELEKTFATLAARVTRDKTVTMEVGQPGNSAPLETAAAKEAIVNEGDRSTIAVVLKFAVQNGDTFGMVRTRAEKFISGIEVSGRAEVVTGEQQYIGVSEPKKHREALLRKIADDARLLQSIFGAGGAAPAISLTGLEGRVKTKPSGPLELEMYIPYSVYLGPPVPPGPGPR